MKSNADKAVEICDAFSRAVGFGRTTIEYEHSQDYWTLRWYGKKFEQFLYRITERALDFDTDPTAFGVMLGEQVKREMAETSAS